MLAIIAAKLLLNGAIKTFIVKPIMTATMTVIPQSSVIQASLLDHNILISVGDLIKFGAEALYHQFVGKKLDFQIEKISKYMFGISPADEFAALFSKQYSDDEELIIDLTKFEDYLDGVMSKFEMGIIDPEFADSEVDGVLNSIIKDLDFAINLSNENMFDEVDDEQLLIDQILEKNLKLVTDHQFDPLSDFPEVPKKKLTDQEEIEKILANFA